MINSIAVGTDLSIGQMAYQSLIEEVETTPKPGLVDKNNTGAHTDMTLETFYASAASLRPFFTQCAKKGMEWNNSDPCSLPELFRQLRPMGVEAEQQMFAATSGVNTHKGAIFSMGLFCCATGLSLHQFYPFSPKTLSFLCRQMTRDLMDDFNRKDLSTTHGKHSYINYQITGIRGEAALGFPSVFTTGWPVYKTYKKQGFSRQTAGACTLLHLIGSIDDTNIISRSNIKTLRQIHTRVQNFLKKATAQDILSILPEMDQKFIRRGISPGGCADLLALIYFLDMSTAQFFPENN